MPPGRVCSFVAGCKYPNRGGQNNKGATTYRAEVVPWLWMLTRQMDSRIFQQRSVPEILARVLNDAGIAFELRLQSRFEPRNFVAQYRESDFAFISRLMEEEGIFYFFNTARAGTS